MADGGRPRLTSRPTPARAGTHPDPARRRVMRGMVVLVPMVVPAIMGAVVLLVLR